MTQPLEHSAGTWVTLTIRLQTPDRDFPVPDLAAINRALFDLIGAPLLVDDINLQHHQRFPHRAAEGQHELLERMRDDAAANGDLEGAAALDERLKEDLR